MDGARHWRRKHGLEAKWAGAGVVFFALFCSDGERAENSTKQAELLGGYTPYEEAVEPITGSLSNYRCTRYDHAVHI